MYVSLLELSNDAGSGSLQPVLQDYQAQKLKLALHLDKQNRIENIYSEYASCLPVDNEYTPSSAHARPTT